MRPMLATPAPDTGLPTGPAWVYEVKWDGMRVLVDLGAEQEVRLTSRLGNPATVAFPELSSSGPRLPADTLLDAEVVAFRGGVPRFEALAERMHVADPRVAAALAVTVPCRLIVFDVLRLSGTDVTDQPWTTRRDLLERMAAEPWPTTWQLSPVYDDGSALLEATAEQGLEGVMAKRRAAPYRPGVRSADWVKLAHRRTCSCVVGGWRPETADARRLGALLLGRPDTHGALRFAGRVGSGLAADTVQRVLLPALRSISRTEAPFAGPVPAEDSRGTHWVEPLVVVEVRHLGHTEGGRLRQPVFLGVRPDLTPAAVRAEE